MIKAKNTYCPTESEEQQLLFEWAWIQKCKYRLLKLLFHIPNEGKRSAATGARMKAEGMRSGVPDLFLPLCRLGSNVYRMEKYNGENKIFRYKVTGISYELHGDETSPLYSARCAELEGYATERLMFFESAVGKTVFLAEEDVEGGEDNG